MAIIWKKKVDNTHYEVRSHGASRRLYTDDVFHSQHNENTLFTGSVWDILALPALLCPAGTINSILVLGVGGGSVIQTLLKITDPISVTGIELNPTHLYVAKRFFKLNDKRIKLVQADAVEWINQQQGPKFDLIIEDLYGEKEGEPVRVAEPNEAWFHALSQHLSEDGLLVMNFISKGELKKADYFYKKKIQNQYSTALQLNTAAYENCIGVFAKRKVSAREIKSNLEALALPKKQTKKLNYSCRKLISSNSKAIFQS